MPRLLWLIARSLRKSVTAGLSSASFCRIASAVRYSASASAGLPVSISRMPRLLWLSARPLRNSVTAGLSSASFCRIASACAVLGLRLRRLARLRQQDADAVDRVRQVAAGLVRGPGGGGQRLLVGPRQAVGRQRLGGLARRWTGASPAATGRPPARPAPPGRHPAGPASSDSGRAVGRQRLVGLAGRFEQAGDGRQAAADVGRRRGVGPRLGRQRLAAPPAPRGAPPARPPCGRPCRSARPARSSPAPAPAARPGRSPCPAGPRACRRSRRPTSAAGRAAP